MIQYLPNGDQLALVNFGPDALISEAKETTFSGNSLEIFNNLHAVYK